MLQHQDQRTDQFTCGTFTCTFQTFLFVNLGSHSTLCLKTLKGRITRYYRIMLKEIG